ncbi:ATP-binding cassette domain-containing protein [Extibacter muris]|uniref:ATP-binding cassette domain-containing protein n=1 Tax=Extibacter muris TaxID=1796622 RepID=UPI001D089137|nr:ATP-binding cassette domain-containing protein [Extibacter muris]MCB6203575.1 ATP-binding cassette domain-containing protein [Extibacter muris]MCQ4665044.1 ATP-binding cassette domain-containing protein [Extibacter muris]MCQ4694410.1 ATP-binding cassette domain-containing protein [Extibacter muris]
MTTSANLAISVKGIKKSFQKKNILKGVDIAVERGSIFALLGSNGAGKTTLIKIMTTLMKSDSGQVLINGYNVQDEPLKAKTQFSLTGQFAAIDEELTGRNNLQIIGELHHIRNIDKKSEELLNAFNLREAGSRAVSSYSGGMRRRLDIAMSIMSEPSIIFLDEPTTGLDPQNRSAMWDLVKALANVGTTIFLTTQYLEEAEVLADKIAILDNGFIVKSGTPEELKRSLPQGVIEFSFHKDDDLLRSKELLNHFEQKENLDNLSLTIVTDGSMEQFSKIFNQINNADIKIAGFTQKLPTLEDVFYTTIRENEV